ncbi:ATP-binding protein [Clostridium cadaveris]|uniref:ATP-binding protein n=1 Tax=Clostridium cadaveris TaxID=1529 RepID=UPI000C084D58|nr:ATP-binding protein [Clostridium cadaveris]NME66275.1 ATP-binding protein [Clostridium cadaveris]
MIKGYQEKVLKIYDDIRYREREALKNRKEEIFKNHPEIMDVEQSISKLSLEIAMTSFKDIPNREERLQNLKNKLEDLRVKKSELLVANGYNMDDLSLHYNCSKCKDTGFIGVTKCSCFNKKLINLYYSDSHVADMLRAENFNTFDISLFNSRKNGSEKETPRRNIENIYSKALAYVDTFKLHSDNLLFYGNSGTGKTFMTHCIAKELLDRGFLVVYRTAEELIKDLRSIRYDDNKPLEELIFNSDLLIIDDLGTENINDFSKGELFNLINKKILTKNKMIISTNLTMEQLLQTYSERITSRLLGNFDVSKFYGDDIRICKNLKRLNARGCKISP